MTEKQLYHALEDKTCAIMEAILPYARKAPQKGMTEVVINNVTRKTKILFMILPEWATNFPPYNLARLIAVAKKAGYDTDAYDLNVKAWQDSKNWAIDYDPWHGSKEWRWMGSSYHDTLHEHLRPLMEKYLDLIGEKQIDVIGFSLYYCNLEPTDWMAKEIKRRYPHITIIAGGPQCHSFPPGSDKPWYDYTVSGEGESLLLDVLDEIESGKKLVGQKHFRQLEAERLNLDTLPVADYSHFEFSEYNMSNGVCAEISRGCTAKCVFCSETHYWKYRGRQAQHVIDEILALNKNYGTTFVWFLDSLVNGNINELRAFCKGIIASGVKINWTGYSRCDGRMDLEFYKDLYDSGCINLNYGVESGSDKVLRDMDKGVTVVEMEQNFKDGNTCGVGAQTNWIIGFPTESTYNFYESMMLIWRNRLYFDTIATGMGSTENPDSILSQASEKYGVLKAYDLNNWITVDFSNSKVHRLIRLISINLFLAQTPGSKKVPLQGHRSKGEYRFANIDASNYCTITYNNPEIFNTIEFEQFDFNIIDVSINPLANTVVNEIWPMLRMIWRTRGAFTTSIRITPESAYRELGDRLGCNLNVTYLFSINEQGEWEADFTFDFRQDDNAWKWHDYARETSTSARRARTLGLSGSNGEIMLTPEKFKHDLDVASELNEGTNFSFDLNWIGKGVWG